MRPPRGPAVVLLALALVVLTGCGSGGRDADPGPPPPRSVTSSAPSPSSATTSAAAPTAGAADYCHSLLSDARASRLAGRGMGHVDVQPVGATPGCRWVSLDGSAASVEAVNASSSTWARQLPQIAASLRAGGVTFSAALDRSLAEARRYVARGQEVDPDLACEVFAQLGQATGAPAGADATLRVTPSVDAPTITVTSQACTSDEYSFVELTAPGIAGELDARVDAVRAALQQVQGGPLHF